MLCSSSKSFTFFFFNDTATTEIYTLSLHDALPISDGVRDPHADHRLTRSKHSAYERLRDRKSTRLNSSHQIISYAVFCLKKKKKQKEQTNDQSKQHRQKAQQPRHRH